MSKRQSTTPDTPDLQRRRVMRAMLSVPAFAMAACGAENISGQAASPTAPAISLNPTPACADDDDDDPTPAQTEGPYFTSNSPERSSLREAGITGTLLTISGQVVNTLCQPIPRAKLDWWHADNAGAYDNSGYKLRGHQFTDDNGRFTLLTIVAGLYPGRTRHIHVKTQAPNKPVLTTQLYFPGEPRNAGDGIYSSALLMQVEDAADGKVAAFTFVLNV